MRNSAPARPSVTRGHRNLLVVAAIMTCLLVALGGTVCATESGTGCPDWPGCYGRIIPPPQINAIIEYTHRSVAALTTPLVIAAAVVSWRRARVGALPWVSRPLALAILFVFAVIVFGAFAVLTGLPPVIAAIDLGSALLALALVVTAAVAASAHHAQPGLSLRFSTRTPLSRLSLAALASVYVVYVAGVLVAGQGSLTRCLGWPLWAILPDDRPGWPQAVRLAFAAVAALLIVAVVIQAWRPAARVERSRQDIASGLQQPLALRRTALWAGVAFAVEFAVTALLLAIGTSSVLLVLHVFAAAALWALLVATAARSTLVAMAHPAAASSGSAARIYASS